MLVLSVIKDQDTVYLVILSTQRLEWSQQEKVRLLMIDDDHQIHLLIIFSINYSALKIHISSATKKFLDKFEQFIVAERGDIIIKGKGIMRTYWLLNESIPSADQMTSEPLLTNFIT